MIILGVDPGTLNTGYAVIKGIDEKLKLLDCGVISMTPSMKLPVRLKKIYDGLVEIIESFIPDEFAIETAFYSKNVQSTLKLGHARGVSILAAVNKQIPTTEYSPREVKKSVTGIGNASKAQVGYMVTKVMNLRKRPEKMDITDALAVAICHHNNFLTVKLKSFSWNKYIKDNPEKVKFM